MLSSRQQRLLSETGYEPALAAGSFTRLCLGSVKKAVHFSWRQQEECNPTGRMQQSTLATGWDEELGALGKPLFWNGQCWEDFWDGVSFASWLLYSCGIPVRAAHHASACSCMVLDPGNRFRDFHNSPTPQFNCYQLSASSLTSVIRYCKFGMLFFKL